MNITKQISNIFMPFLLPAAMLMSSCEAENLGENGTPLPDGEYPLQLTASVDGMMSRTAGKDAWTDGDVIGVRIGDSEPGKYKLNADGRVKEFVTPLYWQNTTSATVTAWYPYEPQTDVNISYQWDGFEAFDFLYASADNQSYLSPTALKFKHQMAKVKYTLVAGDGITDEDLEMMDVFLLGDATASFSEGVLSAADQSDGRIYSRYDRMTRSGEALLVPQDMTGKKFIMVNYRFPEFASFSYTPENQDAGLLKAGMVNTYTITINSDGIDVVAVSGGEWTDSGNENLPIYTHKTDVSQVKIYDYYLSDGSFLEVGVWRDVPEEYLSSVVGVVFQVGQNYNDKTDYSSTGIGQKECHGYVVALQNAGSCTWGVNELVNSRDYIDDSGYRLTQNIKNHAVDEETFKKNFPAAYAAVSYENTVAAPQNSTGWFLPSSLLIKSAIGGTLGTIGPVGNYSTFWSSTESGSDRAYVYQGWNLSITNPPKTVVYDVRAILAF